MCFKLTEKFSNNIWPAVGQRNAAIHNMNAPRGYYI